ncbi:TetR/AcrR family transcriptional regulator [Erwinia sp. JUb26]|uniref:TetR/AcrR family transcriptional regulator n=1 Tax=Erwinia sp. JUb26 TaxID=2485126 RepID=UPI000F4621B1|nr:helix-turn-helix domain-containing protein [Erwinia sp. JUb26]ROR11617.1 TetR family transcriptional regulator [Erwinia sp. JUb26]
MDVNEKKRGRPAGKLSPLSADGILETAKHLMKEEGKVPSIRALATQLNVDPMAIYHYFNNKNSLLEALTTSLVAGIYVPQERSDWEDELTRLCVSYIEILREYSGLLQTILSMTSQGPAQIFTERYKIIVSPLALPQKAEKDGLDLLADYLHGFALSFSCCPDSSLVRNEMMNGPLTLICHSLRSCRA